MSYKNIAYYILIGFFCFITKIVSGQDQKVSDSLILHYESGTYNDDELELLNKIVINTVDLDIKLQYSELLINKALKDSSFLFLYYGYLQKGNAFQIKGQSVKALESYFTSLNYANRSSFDEGIGSLMVSLGDCYSLMGNSKNAQNYYSKGLHLLRKLNDSVKIATALLNAGDEYFNREKLDSALVYTKEAEIIFKNRKYLIGQAYSLGNMGMIYAEQGKDELAEKNINEAIGVLEELEDYYPISVYLTYMADIYARKNKMNSAFNYAKRSLVLATNYGLKDQISEANLKLSELYEKVGNTSKSYKYYKDYITYRDSVKNIESVQQMADVRTNYEVSQKQAEVDLKQTEIDLKQTEVILLSQQKKNQRIVVIATAIALFLIGLLAVGLFRRNKFIQKTKQIIEQEKDRSDNLLLNILPEETAKELKDNGKVLAKKFESVTVLFSDFKGFTKYSENLSPEALVETIDFYFSKFDEITEKYGLEKIKTIGDAYMCAGGLPFPTEDHAHKMIKAAFEIAEFVDETKKNENALGKIFDIRIGINTGPVVAGVVGSKKFAYDIWGDTVNVASRMESMSEPGKVNISENTFALIKEDFDCEYRGEIEAKNRGKLKMYFVNGAKV